MAQNAPQPQIAGFPEGSEKWKEIQGKYNNLRKKYPSLSLGGLTPLTYAGDFLSELTKGYDNLGKTHLPHESRAPN